MPFLSACVCYLHRHPCFAFCILAQVACFPCCCFSLFGIPSTILPCGRPSDFVVLQDSCLLDLHFLWELLGLTGFSCFYILISIDGSHELACWVHTTSYSAAASVDRCRVSSMYSVGDLAMLVKVPLILTTFEGRWGRLPCTSRGPVLLALYVHM